MRTETLHPVTDYIAELFRFLGIEEGFANGSPYFDTANPLRATIGYGFNIEAETDNLLLVLEQMGIINDTMTDAEITSIRNEFQTAINNTPDGNRDALRANLNQVASQYGVTSFRISETQGYTIFTEIVADKETRLDALLNNSLAHNSREYVAVMSLFYNGESLVGTRLRSAITNDNRSEAWFEIRYKSNEDRGHASRRYTESNMFNLYDAVFNEAGAKEIMRMYIIHKTDIERYERSYSPPSSITTQIYAKKTGLLLTIVKADISVVM